MDVLAKKVMKDASVYVMFADDMVLSSRHEINMTDTWTKVLE